MKHSGGDRYQIGGTGTIQNYYWLSWIRFRSPGIMKNNYWLTWYQSHGKLNNKFLQMVPLVTLWPVTRVMFQSAKFRISHPILCAYIFRAIISSWNSSSNNVWCAPTLYQYVIGFRTKVYNSRFWIFTKSSQCTKFGSIPSHLSLSLFKNSPQP